MDEVIEVARHNLRLAIEAELPGPDPTRGQRLEQTIYELILAVLAAAVKSSN